MLGATKQEWLEGAKPAMYAAAFSLIATALDFTFTYIGVGRLGFEAEANPFLRGMMREVGAFKALVWASGPTMFYAALCLFPGRWTRKAGTWLCVFSGVGHTLAAATWLQGGSLI